MKRLLSFVVLTSLVLAACGHGATTGLQPDLTSQAARMHSTQSALTRTPPLLAMTTAATATPSPNDVGEQGPDLEANGQGYG